MMRINLILKYRIIIRKGQSKLKTPIEEISKKTTK